MLHDFIENVGVFCSYVASGLVLMLQWAGDVSWMSVGAAVLLGARLVQDVPRAIAVIHRYLKKRKKLRDKAKRNR